MLERSQAAIEERKRDVRTDARRADRAASQPAERLVVVADDELSPEFSFEAWAVRAS
ncbi:hypothetical protein ACSRUE_37630 [Sorangium sp. KYC3313]|uniref:hypothetical protein n=1 Tax=Sorangium sp. KYC3313 TaxID=3449740 RepID=UPI003F8A3408